jgi:hypothetical protein
MGQKCRFATVCFPGTIFLPNSTQVLIKFYPYFTTVEDGQKLLITFQEFDTANGLSSGNRKQNKSGRTAGKAGPQKGSLRRCEHSNNYHIISILSSK